MSNFITA